MNKVSFYVMPLFIDLDVLPLTLVHTKLPPFCTFKEVTYQFEPIYHFGQFEVSGYISDSLGQQTPFSFKVQVINSRPYFKE
jgi:hypothetical protein